MHGEKEDEIEKERTGLEKIHRKPKFFLLLLFFLKNGFETNCKNARVWLG